MYTIMETVSVKTCEIALPLHRRAYAVLGRGSNIDTEIWEAFGMKVSFEKIKEIVTGVSYVENQVSWHGAAPNDELYEQAMSELNAALAELQ